MSHVPDYRPKHGDETGRMIERPNGWLEYRFGPGLTMEMVNVFVDYDYQSNGIGTSMVRECEESAKSYGIKTVYAFVRQENVAAQRFYAAMGYGTIQLPDFYDDGDAVMVYKSI